MQRLRKSFKRKESLSQPSPEAEVQDDVNFEDADALMSRSHEVFDEMHPSKWVATMVQSMVPLSHRLYPTAASITLWNPQTRIPGWNFAHMTNRRLGQKQKKAKHRGLEWKKPRPQKDGLPPFASIKPLKGTDYSHSHIAPRADFWHCIMPHQDGSYSKVFRHLIASRQDPALFGVKSQTERFEVFGRDHNTAVQTFPQSVHLNSGWHTRLEEFIRGLSYFFGSMWVIRRPFFEPRLDDNGETKLEIKYVTNPAGEVMAIPHGIAILIYAESPCAPPIRSHFATKFDKSASKREPISLLGGVSGSNEGKRAEKVRLVKRITPPPQGASYCSGFIVKYDTGFDPNASLAWYEKTAGDWSDAMHVKIPARWKHMPPLSDHFPMPRLHATPESDDKREPDRIDKAHYKGALSELNRGIESLSRTTQLMRARVRYLDGTYRDVEPLIDLQNAEKAKAKDKARGKTSQKIGTSHSPAQLDDQGPETSRSAADMAIISTDSYETASGSQDSSLRRDVLVAHDYIESSE